MSRSTKIFLSLLVLIAAGGLLYWQSNQQAKIDVKQIHKTGTAVELSFVMSYQGIRYEDKIAQGGIWKRTQKGYRFEAYTQHGQVHFFIKDKDGSILQQKSVTIA